MMKFLFILPFGELTYTQVKPLRLIFMLDGSDDAYIIRRLVFATINLPTKFEVFNSTHYNDMKGDKNVENGVVWGN